MSLSSIDTIFHKQLKIKNKKKKVTDEHTWAQNQKKKKSWKENYQETVGTPSWYTNAFNSVLIFFFFKSSVTLVFYTR